MLGRSSPSSAFPHWSSTGSGGESSGHNARRHGCWEAQELCASRRRYREFGEDSGVDYLADWCVHRFRDFALRRAQISHRLTGKPYRSSAVTVQEGQPDAILQCSHYSKQARRAQISAARCHANGPPINIDPLNGSSAVAYRFPGSRVRTVWPKQQVEGQSKAWRPGPGSAWWLLGRRATKVHLPSAKERTHQGKTHSLGDSRTCPPRAQAPWGVDRPSVLKIEVAWRLLLEPEPVLLGRITQKVGCFLEHIFDLWITLARSAGARTPDDLGVPSVRHLP
jgi:hypothetical protein